MAKITSKTSKSEFEEFLRTHDINELSNYGTLHEYSLELYRFELYNESKQFWFNGITKETISSDWTLDYYITENSLILYNLYHRWEIFDRYTGKPKSLLTFSEFYCTKGVHPIMIFTIKNSDYIYYYTDKVLYNILKMESKKI